MVRHGRKGLLSALIADLRVKGNFNGIAKTLLRINSTPKDLEHFSTKFLQG